MSNTLPRKPVRFVPQNDELLKAQEGSAGQRKGATDFSEDIPYAQVGPGVEASYRVPTDRVNGNAFFRRYINGELDARYAADKAIDAMRRVKNSGGVDQLNDEEKVALCLLFPSQFNFIDSPIVDSIAAIQCRLTSDEVERVRQLVGTQLAEELNWNAGLGGGSVPGRHHTYS